MSDQVLEPPHDDGAERGILAAILATPDVLGDLGAVLVTANLYRPAHRLIYQAMLDLSEDGVPPDSVLIGTHLSTKGELLAAGGAAYISGLEDITAAPAAALLYAQEVKELALSRDLIEFHARGIAAARAGSGLTGSQALGQAQSNLDEIGDNRIINSVTALVDAVPETIDGIEARGKAGDGFTGIPTGFIDLDELTSGFHPGQMIIVAGRPGSGKALALDTPLATPTGWTTMGEAQVGDFLIGGDGKPTRVVAATEVMHGRPCYLVSFSDGSAVVADAEHQWLTSTRATRRVNGAPQVTTTQAMADTVRCVTADRRLNHSIATGKPLDLPEADLLVSPYALGVWLGDGHSASARFTTADPEICLYLEDEGLKITPSQNHPMLFSMRLPDTGWFVHERNCVTCGKVFQPKRDGVFTCGQSCGGKLRSQPGRLSPDYRKVPCVDCGKPCEAKAAGNGTCQDCRNDHGTLQALLRKIGVLNNKHIPAQYLRASEPQRRALLAGLLDTDGYASSNGNVEFAVTSERLARDAHELALSLGFRAVIRTKRVKGHTEASSTSYTLSFVPDTPEVFRLTRKQLAVKERARSRRAPIRYVTEVTPVASIPVRCVEVDNADHLYLAGATMIPTHNSTLGADFARSAAIKHKLPTLLCSLEMSTDEITMRIISALTAVPLKKIRNGDLEESDWKKISARSVELYDSPLWIDDSPNNTIASIRTKARRLKQRDGLKLIIIDYAQLMSGDGKYASREQEVSAISRGTKLLAKELEVPVVLMAQLNRGPEQRQDKKPQVSDLRESGSLEQDSDVVILVHREEMYDKETPRVGEADLIIGKQRNGPQGIVTISSQLHIARFADMARM